jgi:hypothetical protein
MISNVSKFEHYIMEDSVNNRRETTIFGLKLMGNIISDWRNYMEITNTHQN